MNYNKDTKKRIINGAELVFLKNGNLEISISELAKVIGIAKGLIYYYFETKEDLVRGVIQTVCQKKIEVLRQKLEENPSFYEQILTIYDAYQKAYPYHNESCDMDLARFFHKEFLLSIDEDLNRLIEKGREDGHLKSAYAKEMFMMTLEGIFSVQNVQNLSWDTQMIMIEQALNFKQGTLLKIRRT